MIDATNRGDSNAFVKTFSRDAYVHDWGREFHGRQGAANWSSTDNIGVGAQIVIRGIRPGPAEGDYLLDITVTSRRFNGDGIFDLHVEDGLITRLSTG